MTNAVIEYNKFGQVWINGGLVELSEEGLSIVRKPFLDKSSLIVKSGVKVEATLTIINPSLRYLATEKEVRFLEFLANKSD